MILKTTNLSKVYAGKAVVNDVNIEIPKNTIYALIGANGAGKSTVIKMLLNLVMPTSGSIEINGYDLLKQPLLCLKFIGCVIEQLGLYEHLSAYKNLEVICKVLGIDENEIAPILKLMGLEEAKDKAVAHFSLGMKQRLAIGCALINKPKILLLDEPTNGLDPIAIDQLKSLIKNLPNNNVTVLVTSHSLSDVEEISNYVGMMDKGRLVYQGPITHFNLKHTPNLVVKVDDLDKAINILKNKYTVESVEKASILRVFNVSPQDYGDLNKELVEHGIVVSELFAEKADLKTAFLDRAVVKV